MGWLIIERIKSKIWASIVRNYYDSQFYPYLYGTFLHSQYAQKRKGEAHTLYYTARPNPGAGIGHQMANWIAGYWYSKLFGLNYAYIPFPNKEWDTFLGFGIGEKTVEELTSSGYKVKKLPLFRGWSQKDVSIQKKIFDSYSGRKIIFMAEQDQALRDQFLVMDDIQRKFYVAPSRKNDELIYDKCHFNIAIHIRRGDIMGNSRNSDLSMRILGNDYYYNVLKQALERFRKEQESHIYIFSQGTSEDFPEFDEFKNIHWCFNMSAKQSFLHMVYADLLITSKSSFSYNPALMNKGIKLCPKDFWHGYPNQDDWFLCDNNGNIL